MPGPCFAACQLLVCHPALLDSWPRVKQQACLPLEAACFWPPRALHQACPTASAVLTHSSYTGVEAHTLVRDSITTEHEQQLIAAGSPKVLVKPGKDAVKVRPGLSLQSSAAG